MRARNIKPGTFKNEILGTADPLLTLLFEGLWCLADREGRLEDRPLRIKAEIFPYREGLNIDDLLATLGKHGFITRYEVGGNNYLQINKFKEHQNPHHTERKSSLPTPVSSPLNTREYPADSLIPDSLIPDSPIPVSPPNNVRSVTVQEAVVDVLIPEPPEGVDECVEQIQAAWKKPMGQVGMVACFEAFQFECKRSGCEMLEAARRVRDKTLIIAKLMTEWPPGDQKFIPKLTDFMRDQGYENEFKTWERGNGAGNNSREINPRSAAELLAERDERARNGLADLRRRGILPKNG